MSTYSDAYNTFRTAESAAALFDNPKWTRSALHKERKARLEAAREALLNTLPATAPGGAAPGAEKAEEALRSLRPMSADAVAVSNNEWAKVEARLNAGQNLARLIETADQETLIAIVDRMPTRLVSTSPEPADAIAEIHALAIARLAALGDTTAQAALAAQQTAAEESAWRQVFEQAAANHAVGADASAMLYNAAPEEWKATVGRPAADPLADEAVSRAVRRVETNRDLDGGPIPVEAGR